MPIFGRLASNVGSSSGTGLRYWVVFASFGVTLKDVVPGWLTSSSTSWSAVEGTLWVRSNSFKHDFTFTYTSSPEKGTLRDGVGVCASGLSRFFFVYVCKESVEHLLLSAGGGERR